ncbi:MAG: hypothetical protein Q9162_005744 [Coniocarpon cinnabarinum]
MASRAAYDYHQLELPETGSRRSILGQATLRHHFPRSNPDRYVKNRHHHPHIPQIPNTSAADVREPAEVEAGRIPTAINIPISSQPDALMLPPEEFEDRFGFEKPDADKEVVFYCKAGVRSSAAAKLASQSGYTKIGEYRGSWLDWNRNGGKVERGS